MLDVSAEAAMEMAKNGALLLDVRMKEENEASSIPNSVLIPLGELQSRWEELPKDRTIVVYCHHGPRSQQAAIFLRSKGLEAVNLDGGIELYSEIDRTVPKYDKIWNGSHFTIVQRSEK